MVSGIDEGAMGFGCGALQVCEPCRWSMSFGGEMDRRNEKRHFLLAEGENPPRLDIKTGC